MGLYYMTSHLHCSLTHIHFFHLDIHSLLGEPVFQLENMGFVAHILLIALFSGTLLAVVQGEVHYYDFVLREKNFTRLCATKSMLVVNDSFPGPTIHVHKGDTVYVNVHNQGYYGVTLHWHGVKQPRNPWSDGPEYVTQCGIEPGTNFTYEVIFSTEEGTLWWHAHSDWTRNSVHGAIVIYPAEGTLYPFPKPDGEEIAILGSWFTYDLFTEVIEDLESGEDLPVSIAYTINGQPGDFCNCSKEWTHRWKVDYGKTYLLRLINAAMDEEMFFAIAQHTLMIVAVDGAYVKPIVSNYLMISAGQTMDILVTANQSLSHYYMAAREFYTDKLIYTGYDKTNATAIVEYTGTYSPPESPLFPSQLPGYTDYDAAISFNTRFRSLANSDHPIDVPQNITRRMFITTSLNESPYNSSGNVTLHYSASLSNISWVDPATDVLQAYYRNLTGFYKTDFPDQPTYFFDFLSEDLPDALTLAPKDTKVKVLDFNEEVEIVYQSTNVFNSSQDHPMHFHGHSFYVVGHGTGIFDPVNDPKKFNLVDPPYLNTVSVSKFGWVALRFKAENPGVWLWHCHLDHHYSWGMNVVMIVKNGNTEETSMRDPPPYMPPCKGSSSLRLRKNTAMKAEEIDMI